MTEPVAVEVQQLELELPTSVNMFQVVQPEKDHEAGSIQDKKYELRTSVISSPSDSVALPEHVPVQSADDSNHVTISDEIHFSASSNDSSHTTTRTVINGGGTKRIYEIRQDSVFSRSESGEFRFKLWRCSVAMCVLLVVILVWGLCAIPVVFYHIPVCPNTTSTVSMETNTTGEQCSTPIPYNGTVCRNELQSFANCLPNTNQRGTNNAILIQIDQLQRIEQLLRDFRRIARPDCMAAAVPFLCIYTLGLCDDTGRGYSLSSSQCIELSTGVCQMEWDLAKLVSRPLPDCESFPEETVLVESCDRGGSGLGSAEEMVLESDPTPPFSLYRNLTCTNITCRDGFYCNRDTGTCFPRCGSFKQHSHTTTLIVDIVEIIAASVGIISGVAMLVIAVTRRKKIFVFPTAFVVYQTMSLLVLAIFVIINYFNREKLYCSSEDLLSSLENPTPFCIISGIVFYYTIFQVAIWWILHITALLWKIQFPFHARKLKLNHIDRYIHAAAIILGLLLPSLPVIIAMSLSAVDKRSGGVSRCGVSSSLALQASGKLGFGMTQFPPILCTGTDSSATYYSFNLLLNVILIVGMTMLIGIFWMIHKRHGLIRVKHSGKNIISIGSAERKVLLVFCYYSVLAIITLVTQSLVLKNREAFVDELIKYFACEQSQPDTPCSREGFERLSYPVLIALSYTFLTLFPLINFLFVVNIRETKERLRKWSSSAGWHSSSNQ